MANAATFWRGARQRGLSISAGCGFTLIELLVVIAVLTLLMAILLPTLQRIKRQAQAVACRSNLRQWGLYYCAYTMEHDGTMPGVAYPVPLVTVRYADARNANDLLLCPAASKCGPIEKSWGASVGSAYEAWGCRRGHTQIASSYGQNLPGVWFDPNDPKPYDLGPWTTCLVKEAGHVPIYMDSRYYAGWPSPETPPPEYEDGPPGNTIAGECMWPFAINRHDGGINSLFMDWSARKVGLKELWTLRWHRRFETAGPWTKAGGVAPEDWPEWMRNFKDY